MLLIFLVLLGARPAVDPDFGWHLQAGTDFLKSGIPKFDPYSYTMPDWPWVDHEWLSDILLALIHNSLGPLALSVLFALVIAATFYWAVGIFGPVSRSARALAAVFGVLASLPILGVRVQVLTLLGIVGLLWFLVRYRRGEIKSAYWLVPLFLLWTNLHGGFVMGFGVLGVFGVAELAKIIMLHFEPKLEKKWQETVLPWLRWQHLFLAGSLALAITLINPYGLRLYYDIYLTLSDQFALSNIGEWQAVNISADIARNFLVYGIVLAIFLLVGYRKIQPTRWLITLVLAYLAFKYWRNMPFFMIATISWFGEVIDLKVGDALKSFDRHRGLVLVTLALFLFFGYRYGNNLVVGSLDLEKRYTGDYAYPYKAIQWAKQNSDRIGERVFNEYAWGGLLVWQFPEQKVFIDGRMPFWKLGERYVFYESQLALNAQPEALGILDKYGVDWVLIMPNRPLDFVLRSNEDWREVYRNSSSVIHVRR